MIDEVYEPIMPPEERKKRPPKPKRESRDTLHDYRDQRQNDGIPNDSIEPDVT